MSEVAPHVFTVALTGGIAAGKSLATRCFEARGIHVHDADIVAREAVAAGSSGLAAIVETFGHEMLDSDGSLDRRQLREKVFSDEIARRRLEAIIHPRINAGLREKVRAESDAWCVLAIPLLAETWPQYEWADRILLIDAPARVRIARLMQRDGIDTATARRMLDAQADDAARHALADDIIDNAGDRESLEAAIDRLCRRYQELATAP
jgi:dephospho-CoA kinase